MKKLLVLLLTLAMILALAACGGSPAELGSTAKDAAEPEPESESTVEPEEEPAEEEPLEEEPTEEEPLEEEPLEEEPTEEEPTEEEPLEEEPAEEEPAEEEPLEEEPAREEAPKAPERSESSEIDARLRMEKSSAQSANRGKFFKNGVTEDDFSDLDLNTSYGATIGPVRSSNKLYPISSLEELYRECGKEEVGKILVVRRQYDYPKGDAFCAIDFGVMKYLPEEYYPSKLSEVEYVVLVTYDYSSVGTFLVTSTTTRGNSSTDFSYEVDGLQIKATIETIGFPSRSVYYSSSTKGSRSLNVLGGTTDWKCGDPPQIGSYLIDAVGKAMK